MSLRYVFRVVVEVEDDASEGVFAPSQEVVENDIRNYLEGNFDFIVALEGNSDFIVADSLPQYTRTVVDIEALPE